MDWHFPMSTCEVPKQGLVKQPWSAAAVMATIVALRDAHPSLLCFEAVHLVAHALMPAGKWLAVLQHACAVWVATAINGRIDARWAAAVAADALVLVALGGIWTFVSGAALGAWATRHAPLSAGAYAAVAAVLLAVAHEHWRCEHLVHAHGPWPYHVAVEAVGAVVLLTIKNKMAGAATKAAVAVSQLQSPLPPTRHLKTAQRRHRAAA